MNISSKLTIIGTGNLGNAIAYEMIGKVPEIHILNRSSKKSEGTFMDLQDAAASSNTKIYQWENFGDLPKEGISFVCVKEKYSYLEFKSLADLRSAGLRNDIPLLREIAKNYSDMKFEGIIINASNPLDVMTRIFADNFKNSNGSIIYGFGSNLDSLRAKAIISREAKVDPSSVDILVIGEHGDTMVPLYSQAKIGRDPIDQSKLDLDKITEELRMRGAQIVSKIGHSKFGPAIAAAEMIGFLMTEYPRNTIPMSTFYKNGVYLGMPVKKSGSVIQIEPPSMNQKEEESLVKSIKKLESVYSFAKTYDTDKKGRSLLIVDDEPGAAEALKETINYLCEEDTKFNDEYSLSIDICNGVTEALKKFSEKSYDLIVADQRMPRSTGGSGTDLLEKLKGRRIKAIIHSGKATEQDLETMIGITDIPVKFIRKPFADDPINWESLKSLLYTV